LVALLLLEFVFVMAVVKRGLQGLYEQWSANPVVSGTLTGLTIALVLIGGLYLVALRPRRLPWCEVGLRPFPARTWGLILLWTVIALAGSILAMELTRLVGNTYANAKTEGLRANMSLVTVTVAFVSACVISPVYEEVFYRGFLYRWFRTRTGAGWAMLLSALVFAVAHWPTWNVLPVALVCGLVFAWAYERTGSVWPAVFVHGLINLVVLVSTSLA